MSDFKLEFTLKQHTPMIHFQSEQRGATLRATELKPKLDKFINEELNEVCPDVYEKYKDIIEDGEIFPKDKGSNAYKISISAKGIVTKSTPKAYVNKNKETDKTAYQAPYFADVSKSITHRDEIRVTIQSFNTELLTLLDICKDYIFVYENFGTRQSKGFGSFLRTDIKEEEIRNIFSQHKNEVFLLGRYSDYKDAFFMIDNFYKKMKMGINSPYQKSLLFKYMCQTQNFGWEKKFIKNNFPEVIHGDHQPAVCTEPDDQEFRYIRAVLGLAEHNEFRPQGGKKQIKIKSTNGIERFKSPLTFKVFNSNIYILFDDSYKMICDQEFKFNGKPLKTPSEEEFDMYKFLSYVAKETSLKEVTL